MKKKNYIGMKIGSLTIIEELDEYHPKYKRKSKMYLCKCDCGTFCKKSTATFSSMKSCGCLRIQNAKTLHEKGRKARRKLFPPGTSSANVALSQYKRSAKIRNIPFLLSDEQFFLISTQEKCYYCGTSEKKAVYSRKTEQPFMCFGIDRIDNSKGYTEENCATCCKICNRAKDVLTKQEFVEWIVKVYTNLVLQPPLTNVSL